MDRTDAGRNSLHAMFRSSGTFSTGRKLECNSGDSIRAEFPSEGAVEWLRPEALRWVGEGEGLPLRLDGRPHAPMDCPLAAAAASRRQEGCAAMIPGQGGGRGLALAPAEGRPGPSGFLRNGGGTTV